MESAHTSVFVDDTSMQAVDDSFDGVLDKIVPAVTLFGDEAKKLKLLLSPKAAVTASTNKLALALQKELLSYGMHFLVDKRARDLGVTHTAAACRPSKLVKARFNRRHKRVKKTKQL